MIKNISVRLTENIAKVIKGKDEEIRLVVGAFLAGGHVLLEDVPGTGKTMLARSLARSVDCGFRRIQFTPDLLPTDITGINFYNMKQQEFELRKGPVFTNVVLADEINRATPRTQSALLECMEERQTTIDGESLRMERPFFVIATQNPTETSGTYPLPEAQLDRFMIRVTLGYPSRNEEIDVIMNGRSFSAVEELASVCTAEEIVSAQHQLDSCKTGEAVCGYIADIAAATRSHAAVKLGLSTRGAVALKRMSAALAMMSGRDYIMPQDVQQAAPYVIRHRLVCRGYSLSGGIDRTSEEVIRQVLDSVPVPTESIG
ncbi:MAG: AAA family ATPase [Oscillospiraceae bacterium]|nr:AAA family ATPase [Oscillospiraceae bacterium]